MKELNSFSIADRISSFKYALNGIRILLMEEHNFRVHLFASIIVILLGVFFQISNLEWCQCLLVIGLVFIAEMVNSTIENLCDYLSLANDSRIGRIKDIAAGSVLISSVVAFVIGLLVFLPKFFDLFY